MRQNVPASIFSIMQELLSFHRKQYSSKYKSSGQYRRLLRTLTGKVELLVFVVTGLLIQYLALSGMEYAHHYIRISAIEHTQRLTGYPGVGFEIPT